jgi:hypothetical protein
VHNQLASATLVAVTAAVAMMLNQPLEKVSILNINRVSSNQSLWCVAGRNDLMR